MRCHFKICTISFIINTKYGILNVSVHFGGICMIESWHVREALRSRLGSSLVDEPGFADPLAAVLRSYLSYKDTFASLASRVEDTLFNLLYDRLGPSMSVRMNDGSFRRIRTNELKDAADDVMGVLFDQLKVYSVNYQALQSYVMESGSFSAMRVLYVRYAGLMTDGERRVLARVIRDARPASDWKEWLSDSSESPGGVL